MAAAIGGAIALVGLIVSKENKVSEFRQQWIDGLRADLSTFSGTSAVLNRGGLDANKTQDLLLCLGELDCRIRLRFKRNDKDSEKLIEAINGVLAHAKPGSDPSRFLASQIALKDAAQQLLKDEWEVVKKGEKIYRNVLRAAMTVLTTSCLALAWWFLHYFFRLV